MQRNPSIVGAVASSGGSVPGDFRPHHRPPPPVEDARGGDKLRSLAEFDQTQDGHAASQSASNLQWVSVSENDSLNSTPLAVHARRYGEARETENGDMHGIRGLTLRPSSGVPLRQVCHGRNSTGLGTPGPTVSPTSQPLSQLSSVPISSLAVQKSLLRQDLSPFRQAGLNDIAQGEAAYTASLDAQIQGPCSRIWTLSPVSSSPNYGRHMWSENITQEISKKAKTFE